MGVSPISLKKKRCSRHFRPMDRRAGRRSRSLANLGDKRRDKRSGSPRLQPCLCPQGWGGVGGTHGASATAQPWGCTRSRAGKSAWSGGFTARTSWDLSWKGETRNERAAPDRGTPRDARGVPRVQPSGGGTTGSALALPVLQFWSGKRANSREGAAGDAQCGELALGWAMPLSCRLWAPPEQLQQPSLTITS